MSMLIRAYLDVLTCRGRNRADATLLQHVGQSKVNRYRIISPGEVCPYSPPSFPSFYGTGKASIPIPDDWSAL